MLVARSAFDAVVAERDRLLVWLSERDQMLVAVEARHAAQIQAADTRYAELLAAYRQLRLQGAQEITPLPVQSEPSAVERAVSSAFRGMPPEMREAALKKAQDDLAHGMDEDEVVAQIHAGFVPMHEFAV